MRGHCRPIGLEPSTHENSAFTSAGGAISVLSETCQFGSWLLFVGSGNGTLIET
jgi:hypothetical protein